MQIIFDLSISNERLEVRLYYSGYCGELYSAVCCSGAIGRCCSELRMLGMQAFEL